MSLLKRENPDPIQKYDLAEFVGDYDVSFHLLPTLFCKITTLQYDVFEDVVPIFSKFRIIRMMMKNACVYRERACKEWKRTSLA